MEIKVRVIPERGRFMYMAAILGGCALFALSQSDQRQAAFSLEQQGKVTEAEAAWRALSAAHPSNPEPYAHLGLLEARQEHYTEAIAFYRKAMALNPAMPRLRYNFGLAYFKAGEYKDAILQLRPLLKTQAPSTDEVQQLTVLIGMSHFGLGEYAAAAPYLKKAADRDTQNLPLLLTLAHSCLLSKQYQCVLDEFHRIIALNPDSAEAHMLAGEALDEMNDPQAAIREFRIAVQANPKEPNVHFGLGYLLLSESQFQDAVPEFQAELANIPGHAQATLYLADAEVHMNQFGAARPLLEQVVKSNPASSVVHLDLGIVYSEAGQKEDALRELKQAETLNPADATTHWRLAQLYRSIGKTSEANAELAISKTLHQTEYESIVKKISGGQHIGSTPPAAHVNK
jgi:tetratricopeptide (TPR) repeat protein